MSDLALDDWLFTSWGSVADVFLTAIGIYTVLIIYVRIAGLRTFSKMDAFDFATTVAIGSIVAGSILFAGPSLFRADAALTVKFANQNGAAILRARLGWVENALDNDPILLMTRDGMLRDNLLKTHITEADVWAKLREANVFRLDEVHAAVLEVTGDISVLHGPPDGPGRESPLLTDVIGAERATTVACDRESHIA